MKTSDHTSQAIPQIFTHPVNAAMPRAGQCDACSPVVAAAPSGAPPSPSGMTCMRHPALLQQALGDARHTVLASPRHAHASVVNQSALAWLNTFAAPTVLNHAPAQWTRQHGERTVQAILDQMLELDLLVPAPYTLPPLSEANHVLAAWLHITDRCNLRCAYCYRPHADADMPVPLAQEAIAKTFTSAVSQNFQTVKIKYAGGEPLLRLPVITRLHRYARECSQRSGIGVDGVIVSNGTMLTLEMARQILAAGLRLTISLDALSGRPQRCYPDGADASADARRGIETALNAGLIPTITVTVSGRNVGQLPDVLTWILERDLPFTLNFYREFGCRSGAGDLRLDDERFIDGMLAAYAVIEANLPSRSLLASLADTANLAVPHLRRCSAGRSYLVFDPAGRVSKCQMCMDQPISDINADDPLAVVQADTAGLRNVSVEEREACRECQWRYWCGGGCPVETFAATGRYDGRAPHCAIYQALYPEIMRLEGLRILAQAPEQQAYAHAQG